jgi:hypothetical protein
MKYNLFWTAPKRIFKIAGMIGYQFKELLDNKGYLSKLADTAA